MTTFHSSRSPVGATPSHGAGVGGRDVGLLADALRADHDVGQVEADVGERGQELGVEARRALVALPAVAGLHELVDAVRRQRRDEARQVARVLGDRVRLVELADLRVELRRDLAPVDLEHGRVGHAARAYYRRRWTSTSSFSAPRRRCRPRSARRRRSSCAAAASGCSSTAPRARSASCSARSVGLPDLEEIFLTHFHADHFLGLPGMLKTFALRGRDDVPLTVYGPRGLQELFARLRPFLGRLPYPLDDSSSSSRARRSSAASTRIETFARRPRRAGASATRSSSTSGPAASTSPPPTRSACRRAASAGSSRAASRSRSPTAASITPDAVLGPARAGPQARAHRRHGAVAAVVAGGAQRRSARARGDVRRRGEASARARRCTPPPRKRRRSRGSPRCACSRSRTSRRATSGRSSPREAREVFPETVVPRDFDSIEVPFAERGAPQLVKGGARVAAAAGDEA